MEFRSSITEDDLPGEVYDDDDDVTQNAKKEAPAKVPDKVKKGATVAAPGAQGAPGAPGVPPGTTPSALILKHMEQMPQKTEFALIRHYIIITILFFIWILVAFFLMVTPDDSATFNLMIIEPNETKYFKLNAMHASKMLSLEMSGPFEQMQDFYKPLSNRPYQLFCVISVQRNQEKPTIISKMWTLNIAKRRGMELPVAVDHSIEDIELWQDPTFIRKDMNMTEKLFVYLTMYTNIEEPLPVKVSVNLTPINKTWGIIIGALILIILYALFVFELINRTLAALIVSTFALGVLAAMDNRPHISEIITWIDMETLLLLFGMMIMVSVLSESGVFDYLAVLAYQFSKGKMWSLITVLCLTVASLSAILDNVTMMLLMTPVTIRLCEVTNLDPTYVLMSMVVMSNVGAALTPIGDPPNIIIMNNSYVKTFAKVNFGNFIVHMAPAVIIGSIVTMLQIRLIYSKKNNFLNVEPAQIEAIRHQIIIWERAAKQMVPTTTEEEIVKNTLMKKVETLQEKLEEWKKKAPTAPNFEETLANMKATYSIKNKVLLGKATAAFVFVIALISMHAIPGALHVSLGWSALLGALLVLIIADEVDFDAILAKVEWSTLLLFSTLFVIMEALSRLGVIEVIGRFVIKIISMADKDHQLLVAIVIVTWVTGLTSAFLNNIPVITMMVRIGVNIFRNEELNVAAQPIVWALAFGACFGGNGTLLGASANVVSSGLAEQHGYPFTFSKFFIFAFPLMITSLIVVTAYLLIAHCVLTWH